MPQLDTGGAELSTIEIAEAIVKAGGRAIVLSEGGRLAPDLKAAGGELVAFPAATKNPMRLLSNAAAIARMVRSEGVDIVHARSRAPAWSALIGARRAGVPYLATYHGAYNEKGPFKRAYNSVMARGALTIANSRYTADLVKARYGTPEEKIRVIHRGVEGSRYDPAAVTPERVLALRRHWGLAGDEKVVLQAARLTGWKGQSVLIAAAEVLKRSGQLGDGVVVLAGDAQGRSEYEAKLKGEIAAAGLTGLVRLVGHVSDMPAAFAAAHVAVVASTEPEAFGRTATEAQAMGCPIIATNIGAPPETVRDLKRFGRGADGGTGWLVAAGDAEALAGALAEALALPPEERESLGVRARTHVTENFSLRAMKLRTLQVYDELIGTSLADTFFSTSSS